MSDHHKLNLGNAITIIVGGKPRRANVLQWHEQRRTGHFQWAPVAGFRWKGYSGTYGDCRLVDEGSVWIRDHHEPDAPQVRALLAAAALGES